MKIVSNRNEVRARLLHAFDAAVEQYDKANHDVIQNPRYWGDFGVTHRKNGDVVAGGYRDIVDLANLDGSQKVEKVSDFVARFSWDGLGETPVALVHEGYTTTTGKTVPARRWTRVSAMEGRIGEAFRDAF